MCRHCVLYRAEPLLNLHYVHVNTNYLNGKVLELKHRSLEKALFLLAEKIFDEFYITIYHPPFKDQIKKEIVGLFAKIGKKFSSNLSNLVEM